MTSNIHF